MNGITLELTGYWRHQSQAGTSSRSCSTEEQVQSAAKKAPQQYLLQHRYSAVGLPGEECSQFIPTENWPVLLVKGEIDPAIITGTIRYAGYNNSLYSQPIKEAGRVYAKMTTRLDPYTGQARPDLPKVDALGYFNATANGHYEVEGVAPGVYDLYASAMGYPQTLIASGITIMRGQSLHFDGYLQPGPVIHGNVFTKHQFGDEPWPINSPRGCQFQTCYSETPNPNTYIKIELYDGPTVSHMPSSKAHMVSWSPLRVSLAVNSSMEIHRMPGSVLIHER